VNLNVRERVHQLRDSSNSAGFLGSEEARVLLYLGAALAPLASFPLLKGQLEAFQ
jgi:hypothetical protein